MKKYDVVALPTIVVLDRKGNEVGRITEFVRADELATMLAKESP